MVGKVYVSCNLHHFFQRVHQLYGRTQLRALCRIVSMQSLIASIHALRLSVEPANISKAFLDSINIFPVGILQIINNRFFDALCQINTVYSAGSAQVSPIYHIYETETLPVQQMPQFKQKILISSPNCSLVRFLASLTRLIAYYGKLADTSKDGVTAFNTTFAQDGFMLYVPKGVVVDKPIQLVNILRADVNFMVNRRVLVVLEEGAQARLLICDHAMDNVNFLSTQVIEVFAKENATFDLYELEETHTSTVRFSNLYVNQEADSNVLLNGMTLHNGMRTPGRYLVFRL